MISFRSHVIHFFYQWSENIYFEDIYNLSKLSLFIIYDYDRKIGTEKDNYKVNYILRKLIDQDLPTETIFYL